MDFSTGGIYNLQAARRVVSSDSQFFAKTIGASGRHMATWVNGIQVTCSENRLESRPRLPDGAYWPRQIFMRHRVRHRPMDYCFEDSRNDGTDPRRQARLSGGPISLQAHDPTTNLDYRGIRIASLPEK